MLSRLNLIYRLLVSWLRLGISRHGLCINWLLVDLWLTVWGLGIHWLLRWRINRILTLVNEWLLTWFERYITFMGKVALILILSFRCKIAQYNGKVDIQEDTNNLLTEIAFFDELGALHAIELFIKGLLSVSN